jgi:hypothetical protein
MGVEMIQELLAYWKEYQALDDYRLSIDYKSYDPTAYDGQGAYHKSVDGFMNWLADTYKGEK